MEALAAGAKTQPGFVPSLATDPASLPERIPDSRHDRRTCHDHRLHPLRREPFRRLPALTFGHSYDNALDEATHLVLHTLHLPHDLSPNYGQARLTAAEKKSVLALIERRVRERKPVAYLTGEAWFAGLKFKSDARALVPRSPIAEMILNGFSPWLDGVPVRRALDLCTGSGCIGIAMAAHNPDWQVDLADISDAALSLARENILFQNVEERVRALKSDLFAALKGEVYDLIVSNPPYVTEQEFAALAARILPRAGTGLEGRRRRARFRLAYSRRGAEASEHGRLADRRSR